MASVPVIDFSARETRFGLRTAAAASGDDHDDDDDDMSMSSAVKIALPTLAASICAERRRREGMVDLAIAEV